MADDTPPPADDFNLKYERFRALGGDETIYHRVRMYHGAPVIGDLVTDKHRELVLDLRGAGLKQEAIASILGISRDAVMKHFKYELETGLALSEAAAATALMHIGLTGDEKALTNYLKNHPDFKWGTKTQVTGKDGAALIPENATQAEANQVLLSGILTALSTDKTKFKRPAKDKLKPIKVVESDKPKPVKAGTTRKKAKGD